MVRPFRRSAPKLSERLMDVDPTGTAEYETRLGSFTDRWEAAIEEWETRGEALAGLRVVSHHRSFSYLARWLDLDIAATMEPKPGIPPSGAYLAGLLERLTPRPPLAVIRTPYANERPSRWLSERLNVPAVVLPYTVEGNDQAADLFGLFDNTLTAFEEMAK